MFFFGFLLTTVASILQIIINIYSVVIIISVVISWVNADPYNPFVRVLRNLTEPIYYRMRKWLPKLVIGKMDLSPFVLLLALQLVNGILVNSMFELGRRLGG